MRTLSFPKWLLTVSLASFCLAATAQDRPDPEQLRGQARELMDKARDLKSDGQMDESERAARKAKDLLRQAEDLQQKRRDENRDRAADLERPRRPDRRDDRALNRPDQRGPEDRALPRPRAERRLRDEGVRPSENPDRFPPEFRRDGESRRGERFLRPGPLGGDLALRRYHIRKAIKHLRAAGLYDQADRLEERLHAAVRRLQEFRRERAPEGPAPDHRPVPRRGD